MKILIASSIAKEAMDTLAEHHELVCRVNAAEAALADAAEGCQALVFRSGVHIGASVLEAAPDLELIIRAGSGFDNIDLDGLSRRTLRFVRIPGPGARAVAEMSFALMLGLARRVIWADREWRGGHWVKPVASGRLLHGKTLGIVGAGNIGTTTGRLGVAWGMEVVGCVEHPSDQAAGRLGSYGIELASFDQVLERADFLSVHVPLQPSTKGLIGAAQLATMKPGGFIVNMARGGVVDEEALHEALASGHLAGAALDVHAVEGEGKVSPLADLEQVILTPHIGAQTIDSQRQIGALIVEAIDDHIRTGPATTHATPDNFIIHPSERNQP